eukprot:GHVH01015390.1.p1 GENE.GHVH01015390.1~~GHVH01015390.1.p1  ORF type:complete len:682 (-),score=85.18 GHVH01015390.1:1053-3098(-)
MASFPVLKLPLGSVRSPSGSPYEEATSVIRVFGCTSVHPGLPCPGCGVERMVKGKPDYSGPPLLHLTVHKSTWLAFYWLIMMLECGVIMNPSPLGEFISCILGPSVPSAQIVALLGDAMTISFALGAVGGLVVTKMGPKLTSIIGHCLVIGFWTVIGLMGFWLKSFASNEPSTVAILHAVTCLLGFGVQLVIMSHLWVGILFINSSAAALMILGSGVDLSASMCQLLCNLCRTLPVELVSTSYIAVLLFLAWLDMSAQPNSIDPIKSELASSANSTGSPLSFSLEETRDEMIASQRDGVNQYISIQEVEMRLKEKHAAMSLWRTVASPYTAAFAIFFVVCLWRTKKLFAMNVSFIIKSLGDEAYPNDPQRASEWTKSSLSGFNIISGLAAVPAFFMGVMTDKIGALISLMVVNLLGCIMIIPITFMSQLRGHVTLINLLLATSCFSYMVCSGFLFGMVTAYNIKVFGFKHISTVQGMYISLAGLVSFISDTYFKQEYIESGKSMVEVFNGSQALLVANFSLFIVPMLLFLYGAHRTRNVNGSVSTLGSESVPEDSGTLWLPFLSAVFVHSMEDSGNLLAGDVQGSRFTSPVPIQKDSPQQRTPMGLAENLLGRYNRTTRCASITDEETDLCEAGFEKWVSNIVDCVQDLEFSKANSSQFTSPLSRPTANSSVEDGSRHLKS